MRMELQIVGAEAVGRDMMKLVCIPFTTKGVDEKKPSLMKLAMAGDGIGDIMKKVQESQMPRNIFVVPMDEWIHFFRNRLMTRIVVDINIEEVIVDDI